MLREIVRKLPLIRKLLVVKDRAFGLLERIGVLENQFNQYTANTQDATRSILDNDTVLLQSSIFFIESIKRLEVSSQQMNERLQHLEVSSQQMNERVQQFNALQQDCISQANRQVETLCTAVRKIVSETVHAKIITRTERTSPNDMESGIITHLYGFLASRNAIDVGAHRGDLAEHLLAAGFRVYAFEPNPSVFPLIQQMALDHEELTPSNVAIGGQDGSGQLFLVRNMSHNNIYGDLTLYSSLVEHALPVDLAFKEQVPVTVRSLSSLVQSGELPKEIGVLKSDTEGYEGEVVRGMGELRPDIVMLEYWDRQQVFGGGQSMNELPQLVTELRKLGYHWHLVVYRVDDTQTISFYANSPQSVERSWGNVLFFKDQRLLEEALKYCSSVLPPTYFVAKDLSTMQIGQDERRC